MQKTRTTGENYQENKNLAKIWLIIFIIASGFLFFPKSDVLAATKISEQTTWNSEYLYDTNNLSDAPGLIWSAIATNNVETIIFKLKVESATQNVNVYAYPVNCSTGESLGLDYFGSDKNSSANTITSQNYADYIFTFPNPLVIPGGMCVMFFINSDKADFARSNIGGVSGFSFATKNGGNNNSTYGTGLPYFSLWEGFLTPEIQIDTPPANDTVSEFPYWIGFTATADNDNSIFVDLSLVDDLTGETFYSEQRDWSMWSTPLSQSAILENICNGFYTFTARITDRTTGLSDLATRSLDIAIENNTTFCTPPENFCADFTGTFDEPMCKVVKALFVPDNLSALFKNTQNTINNIWILSVASSVYNALDTDLATGADVSYSLQFGTIPTITVWNTAWLGSIMNEEKKGIIEPYIEVFLWAGFGLSIVAIALKLFKK